MNKLENTPANKAKLFAQYYDQMVAIEEERGGGLYQVDYQTIRLIDYLLLTDIADITDEDAIELGFLSATHFNGCMKAYKDRFYHEFITIERYQYLQSRGYALPYMNLTVANLIEYGWLKIKDHGKH